MEGQSPSNQPTSTIIPLLPNRKTLGFVEVPGLLLVRLMSRCNEKCRFCMVEDEIHNSDDVDYGEAVNRIVASPPETHIEFFGGEPTIYPRFYDLLKLARERGHSCSIASNVRIFHSEKFTRSIADLGPNEIYIRTSLYGDTAELHDYYTATARSYTQTIKGIQNIVASGFKCQVNIVILKQNFECLSRMTQQIHNLGVQRIKFGNLIGLDTCAVHAVRLSVVEPHLKEAIQLAEQLGMSVTVEKTPICLIDERIDLVSNERTIGNWPRAYDDEGVCKDCLVRRWCDGLDPDYARRFGFAELKQVSSVPWTVIKGSAFDSQEPEQMKLHCVMIDNAQLDDVTAAALYDVLQRVNAKHGLLAIFPQKYVRP